MNENEQLEIYDYNKSNGKELSELYKLYVLIHKAKMILEKVKKLKQQQKL